MKRIKLGIGGRTIVAVAAMGVAVAAYAASSVLKDINPGAPDSLPGDESTGTAKLGSRLLFSATTVGAVTDHGTEPWATDGTVIGTVELGDIFAGSGDSNPHEFTVFGSKSYFSASNDGVNRQLFSTGGTPATTALAVDFNPAGDGDPNELTVAQGELWLNAHVNDPAQFVNPTGDLGFEAVRFNGSRWEAIDLNSGGDANPDRFRAVGGVLAFVADTGLGVVMNIFSPTAANRTASENPVAPATKPEVMTAGTMTSSIGVLEQFYLPGDNGTGATPNVPNNPCDLTAPSNDGIVFGGRLYFSATASGAPGVGCPTGLVLLSYSPTDTNYRAAFLSDEATAPYVGFARLVKSGFTTVDLGVATSSLLFFIGDDGTGAGEELWRTNGTLAGTFMTKDINPGATRGPLPDACGFGVLGNLLIGGADDGVNGAEPWVSDGTPAGTHILRDVNTTAATGSLDATCANGPSFDKVDGKVYFAANNGAGPGIEPWQTDGTELGTTLLADINPGAGDSNPRWFSSVANHLVYAADGGTATNAGQEMMFDTLVVNTGTGTTGSGGGGTSGGTGGSSGGGGGGGGSFDLLSLAGLAAAGLARRRRKTH